MIRSASISIGATTPGTPVKMKTPFTPSTLSTSKDTLAAPVASYTTLMWPTIFANSDGVCSAEETNRAPMAETILTFGLSALSLE